ncbi:MAG: BatD family protein [Nannocystaceae bacterium]
MGVAAMTGLAPGLARAAAPTIRVRVGQRDVEVGVPFIVEVEVKSDDRGRTQEPGDPVMPDLPGLQFSFRSSGMSRSMTYRNGLMASETTRTFVYNATALQPGSFALRVGVDDGGKVVFAQNAPTIIAAGAAVPAGGGGVAADPSAQAQAPSTERLKEKVFAQIVTNKQRAYVGEAITTQWEVWQRVTANIEVDTLPVFKDFYAIELEAGEPLEQFVGGRQWRVHPAVRRILFPQKSGKLEIGGGSLTVAPTSGFGLFSRPRGGSFTVRGAPVEIEVLPLPAKGQPPKFSANNVGRYTLNVEVDRADVTQGEALTATFTIAGNGNLKVFDPGAWPAPEGMRSYPPKETFEQRVRNGEIYAVREIEVLYVADKVGTVELPAKSIHFFDPRSAKYSTSTSERLKIKVRPRAEGSAPPSTEVDPATDGAQGATGADEMSGVLAAEGGELSTVLGEPSLKRDEVRDGWLTDERWKRGMLTAPAVGGAALLIAAARRRFRPSERAVEERRYRDRAKMLLAKARASVQHDGDFESNLGALIQAAALRKAGEEAVGLQRSRLLETLRAQGCAPDEVALLGETLDACDAARYGAAAPDAAARTRMLSDIEGLLTKWRLL